MSYEHSGVPARVTNMSSTGHFTDSAPMPADLMLAGRAPGDVPSQIARWPAGGTMMELWTLKLDDFMQAANANPDRTEHVVGELDTCRVAGYLYPWRRAVRPPRAAHSLRPSQQPQQEAWPHGGATRSHRSPGPASPRAVGVRRWLVRPPATGSSARPSRGREHENHLPDHRALPAGANCPDHRHHLLRRVDREKQPMPLSLLELPDTAPLPRLADSHELVPAPMDLDWVS